MMIPIDLGGHDAESIEFPARFQGAGGEFEDRLFAVQCDEDSSGSILDWRMVLQPPVMNGSVRKNLRTGMQHFLVLNPAPKNRREIKPLPTRTVDAYSQKTLRKTAAVASFLKTRF